MENEEKKKSKVGKKILLVIFIILVLVIIWTGRNMIIIKTLQNTVKEYESSTNYHRTLYTYSGDTYGKMDMYYLNGKQAIKLTRFANGNVITMESYGNDKEEKRNTYVVTKDTKTARINETGSMFFGIQGMLYTENFGQLSIGSLLSKITSRECNGKDCYYIEGAISPFIFSTDSGLYIDKETGLAVRAEGGKYTNTNTGITVNEIIDYRYEFNTVTEDDFIEPDISEYTIVNQ